MLTSFRKINDMPELRKYVNETLCRSDQLDPDVFELTERKLVRRGTPCGISFCLHGPRAVRITAIWETDRNRVFFYNSTGERFQQTQLEVSRSLKACLN